MRRAALTLFILAAGPARAQVVEAPLPALEAPWAALENVAFQAAGVSAPSQVQEFQAETLRTLRSLPDAPLADAAARALTSVHRLDPKKAETIRRAFAGERVAETPGARLRRFFDLSDGLHGIESGRLVRIERFDRFKAVSAVTDVQDAADFLGVRYMASGSGVYRSDSTTRVAGEAARKLIPIDGQMFVLTESRIYRLDEDAPRQIPGPAGVELFDLAEIGGRIYASTEHGVYAGRLIEIPEARKVKERPPDEARPRWKFFLPKSVPRFEIKTVTVQAKMFEWEPKPTFEYIAVPPGVEWYTGSMAQKWKVKAHQTAEVDGRLLVSTSSGLHEVGAKEPLIEEENVRRIRVLPSGAYALTGGGVFKKTEAGWERVFKEIDSAFDAGEQRGLLYIAGESALSVYAALPDRWEAAILAVASALDAPDVSREPASTFRADGGSILSRGGRSIFQDSGSVDDADLPQHDGRPGR